VTIRRDRTGWRRPIPPPTGERLFYNGATLEIEGTESELKEVARMARLVGTGKDPVGRYVEGVVYDIPAYDPSYDDAVARGWGKPLDPEDDPARTKTQIANAVVRGDAIAHPVEAEIAAGMSADEALAITHTGDPNASAGDAYPEAGSSPGPLPVTGEMVGDDPAVAKTLRKAEEKNRKRLAAAKGQLEGGPVEIEPDDSQKAESQARSRRSPDDKSTESKDSKS
jgi:hypothetical protein